MVMLRAVFGDNPITVFLYNLWLTCQGRLHEQIKRESAEGSRERSPISLAKNGVTE